MRKEHSLSPANVPVSSAIPSSALRLVQMPLSSPASPQKNSHTKPNGGYTPNTPNMRSSYRTTNQSTLPNVIQDLSGDSQHGKLL
jgi:hypothetical protein